MPGVAQPDAEQRAVLAAVDAAGEALALARWMAAHPELSLAERATSDALPRATSPRRGFAVERGVAGIETAFVARRGSARAARGRAARGDGRAARDRPRLRTQPLGPGEPARRAARSRRVLPEAAVRLLVVGCPGRGDRGRQAPARRGGRLRRARRRADGARLRHAARAPAVPRQPQVRVRVPRAGGARGGLPGARRERARRGDRAVRRDGPAAPAAPARGARSTAS